ncbi:MAG: hypothetical protein ABI868_10290 [Acidobacteriota bacterium]
MRQPPPGPDTVWLRDALRAMAEADANLTAPPRVEQSLMKAWETRTPGPSTARTTHCGAWTLLALAASCLLAVGLWTRWAPGNGGSTLASGGRTEPTQAIAAGTDPSRGDMAWLDSDETSLQIVRLRVAVATLAAQGYALRDPTGDGTVEIEMIVGPDGAARRVRVNGIWPE